MNGLFWNFGYVTLLKNHPYSIIFRCQWSSICFIVSTSSQHNLTSSLYVSTIFKTNWFIICCQFGNRSGYLPAIRATGTGKTSSQFCRSFSWRCFRHNFWPGYFAKLWTKIERKTGMVGDHFSTVRCQHCCLFIPKTEKKSDLYTLLHWTWLSNSLKEYCLLRTYLTRWRCSL